MFWDKGVGVEKNSNNKPHSQNKLFSFNLGKWLKINRHSSGDWLWAQHEFLQPACTTRGIWTGEIVSPDLAYFSPLMGDGGGGGGWENKKKKQNF